jgi:nicotinamide riboside kinase
MERTKRIAIIGPEASGKTELAKKLAAHFGGTATEEFARQYFTEKQLAADYVLSVDEMCEVMEGQQAIEKAAKGLAFIDASTINGPLYAGMVSHQGRVDFNLVAVDARIMAFAAEAKYDAFILCQPHEDLGWVDDGLRSMPNLIDRQRFASACKAFIEVYHEDAPCVIVSAPTWQEREAQAVEGINSIL